MEVHGIGAEVSLFSCEPTWFAVSYCGGKFTLLYRLLGIWLLNCFSIFKLRVNLDLNAEAQTPTLALAQVRAELYKLSSLSLCSNTIGQLATGIMINPPKPGDPSFETFKKVDTTLHTLKQIVFLHQSSVCDVFLISEWNCRIAFLNPDVERRASHRPSNI